MHYSAELNDIILGVLDLAIDGWNWQDYSWKLFLAAELKDVLGLLNGTEAKPHDMSEVNMKTWQQWNATAKSLITTTVPKLIFHSLSHSDLAYAIYSHLKNLFKKPMTMTTTVHVDNTMYTAAHAWKTFGSTCWKCSEIGHKAWECVWVENRPTKSNVRETHRYR